MGNGLVIKLDRFGQVRPIPTYEFIPTLPTTEPDDDGVYKITTTSSKENT